MKKAKPQQSTAAFERRLKDLADYVEAEACTNTVRRLAKAVKRRLAKRPTDAP